MVGILLNDLVVGKLYEVVRYGNDREVLLW